MTVVKTIGLLASALIAFGSISSDACGQAAQDFYRNKQVRLIVGHPVGNDHDVGGRLLAKYLGKHIPGRPNVIVQNMTAAASVAAANYVFGHAPRDGTVMGTFSRNVPSQAMMVSPMSRPTRAVSSGWAPPRFPVASARPGRRPR